MPKLVQQLQHLVMMNPWNVIYELQDRDEVADAANEVKDYLTADPEVYANPEKYFDQVIEINLDELNHILTDHLHQIWQLL